MAELRLCRVIGAGGMGIVYEAEAPDGQLVALKLLQPQRANDDYALRRFRDEALAGLVVSHPNVVSVLRHGATDDGIPFLVMPRVQGEPLGGRLHREGPPSLRRGVLIVRQILAGLDAMHAAGVVHGDVKSDNVLVDTDDDDARTERATLIDFGLAHAQFAPGDVMRRDPEEELVSGTPDYMAPEVALGFGSSTSSDLYAVGVILYELLTGTTPFGGGDPSDIIRRQISDEVVPPSLRAGSAVPPILDRIVMRALAKDPAERFPSATAFSSALHVCLPLLDDVVPPRGGFSQVAPTIEWTRSANTLRGVPRRFPAATPSYRRRTKSRGVK
ncbi:MAG TPA: serine/threonine-protein kinase [Kofleriaceae bacterium]|nr:serine/threonine-protein kinase [Kofleriaceae bacterium]